MAGEVSVEIKDLKRGSEIRTTHIDVRVGAASSILPSPKKCPSLIICPHANYSRVNPKEFQLIVTSPVADFLKFWRMERDHLARIIANW